MVQRTISPRDIEQLSAYMDEQLRPAERSRLEVRLQTESVLQGELESLRRTRTMLRSLPRQRAPRNFTLTPAMVGMSQPRPWQPVFGLASALAVVLLVFVVLGDFLVIPGYVGMFPISQAPSFKESQSYSQPTAEAAKEEALVFPTEAPTASATPSLEPPSAKALVQSQITATPQGTPETGIMADILPEPTSEEQPLIQAAPMTQAEPSAAEGGLTQTPGISNTLTLSETQVLTSTLEVQAVPTQALAEASRSESIPAQPSGNAGSEDQPSPGETGAQEPGLWMQVVFWMVELLLACLAIAAGLISFYLWFTSRT